MQINKKEFLSILYQLRMSIDKKSYLNYTGTYYFTGEYIVSLCDNSCTMIKFQTDFICGIKSVDLISMIENASEEFDLYLDKNELVVKSIDKEAYCNVTDDNLIYSSLIAQIKKEIQNKYLLLPNDFFVGVQSCLGITEEIFHNLGLYIANNLMVCGSNLQINQYIMSDTMPICQFRSSSLKLNKFQAKFYILSDVYLHLISEDEKVIHSVKRMASAPLDSKWFELVNRTKQSGDIEIVIPTNMKENVCSADDMHIEELSIELLGNKLLGSGISTKGGLSFEHELNMDVDRQITFKVNTTKFLYALERDSVTMLICADNKKAYFYKPNYTHVMSFIY